MGNLNKVSRLLYALARLSRDANAVSRGPGAIGKRIVRKAAGRLVGGWLGRIFR